MKKTIHIMMSILIAVVATGIMAGAAQAQGTGPAAYSKARGCYRHVKKDIRAERSDWVRCIALFEKVYDENPGGSDGAKALYSAARLRREAYSKFGDRNDLLIAIKTYNRVIKDYPSNALADDSLYQIGVLRLNPLKEDEKARRAFAYIIKKYPQSDMAPKAQKMLDRLGGGSATATSVAVASTPAVATPTTTTSGGSLAAAMSARKVVNPFSAEPAGAFDHATLTNIDVESKPTSTIVRLKLDRLAAYSMKYTEVGRRTGSPPVLDLFVSYVDPIKNLTKKYDVSSSHLKTFKMKKRILGSGVRFSFIMEPGAEYDVKSIGNDIFITFGAVAASVPASVVNANKTSNVSEAKKSKPLRVVIDPGHGGEDSGAVGPRGTKEKDITLKISKRLARELKKRKGVKVYLTRTRDKTLTLEQRSAFAIKKKADLFISVHVNASRRSKSRRYRDLLLK